MTEIIVCGSAVRTPTADRAVLVLNLSETSSQRETAIRAVVERRERTTARAEQLVESGAASRYLADPLETYRNSWGGGDGDEEVVEHVASTRVTIEFAETGSLGELVLEFAEGGADPHLSWELSDAVRLAAFRGLRAEAVADARRAAEDYARAIGASGVELVSLRDTPADRSGPMLLKAEASGMDVTVRDLAVRVQVEASFLAS